MARVRKKTREGEKPLMTSRCACPMTSMAHSASWYIGLPRHVSWSCHGWTLLIPGGEPQAQRLGNSKALGESRVKGQNESKITEAAMARDEERYQRLRNRERGDDSGHKLRPKATPNKVRSFCLGVFTAIDPLFTRYTARCRVKNKPPIESRK